jgi:hypothetical protein
MIALVLATVLPWVTLGLSVVTAGLLLWKIIRAHERAFVWLGMAVVVWPLLCWLVDRVSARAYIETRHGGTTHLFPYSLAASGSITWGGLYQVIFGLQHLISAALLLVAVFTLCRMNNQRVLRQEA